MNRANNRAQGPQATPLQGLLILGAVVVLVTAFLWLSTVLGLTEVWAPFLLLLVWGSVEGLRLERLLPLALGASLGLGTALAMKVLPTDWGTAAWWPILLFVLALIYCQIMQWLGTFVNLATMLFLTVATIPSVQAGNSFAGTFAALACGVLFFGGLAWLGRWLKLRSARQATVV
jgi:hypothetical protein